MFKRLLVELVQLSLLPGPTFTNLLDSHKGKGVAQSNAVHCHSVSDLLETIRYVEPVYLFEAIMIASWRVMACKCASFFVRAPRYDVGRSVL